MAADNKDTIHHQLDSIGHELRTPLTCVLALVESLSDGLVGPVSTSQQAVLHSIQKETRQALALVSTLSDLSRLDNGSFTLTPAACSLESMFAEALADVGDLARSRSITLSSEASGQVVNIHADPFRLRQMLAELLSAALVTAEVGSRVSLQASNHGSTHCFRAVWEGGGQARPPASKQPADEPSDLFSRLQRLRPLGSRLLQQLCALHGGSLEADEKDEARGSITLRLDFPEATMQAPPASKSAAFSTSARAPLVLLADDQDHLRNIVSLYFESVGCEVVTARDGSEAVSLARSRLPDLIIMDVRMPVLDGLEAVRAIRASDAPLLQNVPIISISGQPGGGEERRCVEAGSSAYLTKPFAFQEFDHAVRRFVKLPSAP